MVLSFGTVRVYSSKMMLYVLIALALCASAFAQSGKGIGLCQNQGEVCSASRSCCMGLRCMMVGGVRRCKRDNLGGGMCQNVGQTCTMTGARRCCPGSTCRTSMGRRICQITG